MKTRCPRCRTKINYGDKYCDKCNSTKTKENKETQKRNLKLADDKLKTTMWQSLRSEVMARDNFCCRLCLINSYVETRTLQVHHIHKRINRPDLTFNESNLVTLCRVCHEKVEKMKPSEQFELLKMEGIEDLEFSL